jgi:hypothetical protein
MIIGLFAHWPLRLRSGNTELTITPTSLGCRTNLKAATRVTLRPETGKTESNTVSRDCSVSVNVKISSVSGKLETHT